MLESSWSLQIELPRAEGATFAGQGATNQHDLRYYDQIDLSLSLSLRSRIRPCNKGTSLDGPPVEPFIDP